MVKSNSILSFRPNALPGIDGCRGGWCVIHEESKGLNCTVISSLDQLDPTNLKRCLIDMPIGLHPKRHIDNDLRNLLRPHKHHSVFSVPVRKAVYANSYEHAKLENLKEIDKSISIQSWNICPKIKSLDIFLGETPNNSRFVEAHPELCFYTLNNKEHLNFKKSEKEGQTERLNILLQYEARAAKCFLNAMQTYRRSDLKADDILDALALFVSNKLPQEYINNTPLKDESNLNMRIAFPIIMT
jgi:predicted RNase H-like nuclease